MREKKTSVGDVGGVWCMAMAARGARAWLCVCVCVLLSVAGGGAEAGECPGACDCKWKNGKEAVLCVSANLSTLPPSLDASTQLLDLTGNLIASVDRDAFRSAGLLNLQKVFLAKCRLKSIDRYAFRKLTNLVELDLSYNALAAVPSHAFESISELRELKLSGNGIQRLLNDAFVNLPQLVRLEMSDCRLVTVEPRAFNGLQRTLEWLKMDKNRLTDIKSTTLTSLDNLHGLELAGNPWNCSCALRPLREWILRHNIPHSVSPACRLPRRLANKAWDKLDLDEFACSPTIEAVSSAEQTEEGGNVSMSCRIGGSPAPAVHWVWKNKLVANVSSGSSQMTPPSKKLYVLHLRDSISRLSILSVEPQDAGSYVCVAENKAGSVQSNVTLAVSPRVDTNPAAASWKLLVASVLVAILFVLASCLAVLCVCALRQKNNTLQATLDRAESYEKIELNHKPATIVMNHSGVPKGANGYSEVAVVGPLKQHPRHSEYRGLPMVAADDNDADGEEEEEEEDEESLKMASAPSRANLTKMSAGAFWEENGVQQHVMRKEVLASGTLYTTAGSHDERNFPDLLGSPALNNSQDNSIICSSTQRFRSRGLADRKAAVSESQSPLLPSSRYSSSDSANSRPPPCLSRSSSTYKLSATSNEMRGMTERSSSTLNLSGIGMGGRRHPSLPASPSMSDGGNFKATGGGNWRHPSLPVSPVVCETPILNILDPSIYSPSIAATTYDYHAAQLERFLEEYRSLQEQLSKMKETCENMRLGKESSTRLVEPLIVHEENPRSILKNKNKNLPQNASANNPYWLPRDSIFDSSHNSSDLFKS